MASAPKQRRTKEQSAQHKKKYDSAAKQEKLNGLHAEITGKVIEQLKAYQESGVAPAWIKPWSAEGEKGGVPVKSDGRPFAGSNTLILWITATLKGYEANDWYTFAQAKALGGNVRAGEKSTTVFRPLLRKETEVDANGVEEETVRYIGSIPYPVFNRQQIDGLPAPVQATPTEQPTRAVDWSPDARIDALCEKHGIKVVYGGNKAAFSPLLDIIKMPHLDAFLKDPNKLQEAAERDPQAHGPAWEALKRECLHAFEATRLHEMVHWSGAESRLHRKFGRCFGDTDYALEELVAELGSAFMCARLGIDGQLSHNTTYIASWIEKLENDHEFIFIASAMAQKAADYVLGKDFGLEQAVVDTLDDQKTDQTDATPPKADGRSRRKRDTEEESTFTM